MNIRQIGLSLLCLGLFVPTPAASHEIRPAIATVTFPSEGTYSAEFLVNMEAVIAGVSPQHKDTRESPQAQTYNQLRELPPSELERRIREFLPKYLAGIEIRFDAARVPSALCSLSVPEVGDPARVRLALLQLCGSLPPGVTSLRMAYAAEFGELILRLPAVGGGDPVALWLKDGELSESYVLGVGLERKTRMEVAAQYTVFGFTHILPKGLDHILFVLGLFLLSLRWKPLLIQVTSFTIAHTITLGLSIFGILSLSPAIVEPLIAASIAYVAIENIMTAELKPWRPFVVFGFGLLHGLGFAGVLNEIGLPRSEFVTALLSFNIGVELGQLAVITLAYLLIGLWWKEKDWYRARLVLPLSALIAATGVYWTIERIVS
ncbi:MAG: HupE/UreJ family protein [Gammaproteobacteria bacterium]|nr:HupE/UreJ family protein [Gammaproteobacteria bacterium]MDH3406537.1 HupE/UreJ family protein [Gammaproteobacteria bacterium]MDH5488007.1 HupE/UreJ family protein [Gammaproteobacteria bacterium]